MAQRLDGKRQPIKAGKLTHHPHIHMIVPGGGLRDVAHTLADRVNAGVAWLAERRGNPRRAGREAERELEPSDGRRRKAETGLGVQSRHLVDRIDNEAI
ncbi:transposase [Ruegeria pomeroyi]|uniref:Transposase n=1 Tax=Ruegeria pomeroyi TaxID=89184 RepID=A0A9Q3ZNQ4_9RHOB|nr:transposase [Ruegeria pomeroyi]